MPNTYQDNRDLPILYFMLPVGLLTTNFIWTKS